MNTFFGNLNTNFLNSIQSSPAPQMPQQSSQPNLLFAAIGAAIRGEDPHTFMSNLAQQHPLLKQYDLNDLQGTAQQVCQQNNINVQDAVTKIDNMAAPFLKK